MENPTSDPSATRPETANSQDSEQAIEGNDDSEQPRPALSLVSSSSGTSSDTEDGCFAKGTAEDKAAMEMYAAMLPRAHILGGINQRHLMIAGGIGLLLIAIAVGHHRLASNTASPPAESGPVAAPTAATPAPAVAAIPANSATPAAGAAAPAPAAPVIPINAAPGVAAPNLPAAEPVTDTQAPSPALTLADTTHPAAALVAVAKEPQAAAGPAPEPEQVAAPSNGAAEAQAAQGCREAIRRRDIKLVSASCETALAADPSLAKPLLAVAKVQFEKGKSAQAAVWARKIVQVNGSLADAYLIMGAAEQEARHLAAAKAAYQRYLELAPKGPDAKDVKSSLKSL